MKTKLIKRVSSMVAILAFLALWAGNAFAIENSSRIVAPYWQSDSGSYTFIAVSHTSLSGMASSIGLTINAINKDKSAFGTAVTFTINSGTTQRIFVVRTNHGSVNPTSISTGKFIAGTTNFAHGHIRIDPIATSVTTSKKDTSKSIEWGLLKGGVAIETVGSYLNITGYDQGLTGAGFNDVTMLSFWGAVVLESNTTGFAMEFIGDMHDSASTSVISNEGNPVAGPAAP